MLPINTIRTGTDGFALDKKGLITTNTPLNCTALTQVDGITVTGTEPSGTSRRVAFKVDGAWYKLSGSGAVTLSELTTQALTADSILAEGNTVAEVSAATSIAGFVGKSVDVAVALMAPSDATEFPKLKLEVLGKSSTEQLSWTEDSAPITLASAAVEVIDLSASITATGGASATVTASLLQDGSWSEYMTLAAAKRQLATAIKFKSVYAVTGVGVGSAKVNSVNVLYRSNNAAVSGENAEIISITGDFDGVGMRFGSVTVKHQELFDAETSAYMAMRTIPQVRERIQIVVGSGERQTVGLKPSGAVAVDPYVNHNTLRLWHGTQEIYSFDFNTELSQISTAAPAGVTVFASYQYGWEPEVWAAMERGSTQVHDVPGIYSTKFTYTLPSIEASKGVAAAKIVLSKPSGSVADASLGTATGSTQMLILPHAVKTDTIVIEASAGTPSWSYDENSRILTVSGQSGAALTASYDWTAETPVCYGFIAAWSE